MMMRFKMSHLLSYRHIFVSIVIFVIISSFSFCIDRDGEDEIEVFIEENGSIISFYDNYYIVDVAGKVTLTNPSKMSFYMIEIPMKLSSLKININDSSGLVSYNNNLIVIRQMYPNSSITLSYEIFGIDTDKDVANPDGVLYNAVKDSTPHINVQSVGNLYKAPLEDVSAGGHEHTRLVSAQYHNPTDFPFYLKEIKITKTSDLNLKNTLDSWTFKKEGGILPPGDTWKVDVYDRNAYEGEVYWLTVDLDIQSIFYNYSTNISLFDEEDVYEILENNTNASDNVSTGLSSLQDMVFVRKYISNKLVNPGDVIDVSIIINNFAPKVIDGAQLYDSFPQGFVIDDQKQGKAGKNSISWENLTLNAEEAKRITYSLKYADNDSFGVDFFEPAILRYTANEVFSQAIPYVRVYVPEKRLFMQKSIEFLSNDEVKVKIELSNMGEADLEHLVLNEYLSSESEFKEITRDFTEKGVWKIGKLKKDNSWEVSYVTDTAGVLNTFPVIYGVPEKSVMKTVKLSNVISSEFKRNALNAIELGGIIAILVIVAVMLLPKGYFRFGKKRELQDIKRMDRDLGHLLKDTTDTHEEQKAPGSQLNASSGSDEPSQQEDNSGKENIRDKKRGVISKNLEESKKKINAIKKKIE